MIFSNYKQEIVAELNNSQPQCTTTALIVCKSIHFDDDTSIYRYDLNVYRCSITQYGDISIYRCISNMYLCLLYKIKNWGGIYFNSLATYAANVLYNPSWFGTSFTNIKFLP